MAVALGDKFSEFLKAITDDVVGNDDLFACQPAVEFYSQQRWRPAEFGDAIAALASGEATGGDMPSAGQWAKWCLEAHAASIAPDAREQFILIMADANARMPMSCYRYLRDNAAILSVFEKDVLKEAIRGQLSNFTDADDF